MFSVIYVMNSGVIPAALFR